MSELALQTKGITKQFPGVLANDHVDFDLRSGEIHALLGENGAGKTTLMNIVYGLYHSDSGKIIVNEQDTAFNTPRDAIDKGIGMVHQHFMLIPVFTVTENIMLGVETLKGIKLDRKKVSRELTNLSKEYKLEIDPDVLVEGLPVGVQQRIEIIKALYRNSKILILDEPTAILTPQEIEDLYHVMHMLTDKGVSIIFITHKLKEVFAVADRITVMRNGKVVGTVLPEKTDESHLAKMMVGREVILKVKKKPAKPKETVLQVNNLKVLSAQDITVINNISFDVKAGEVLGIAGVQGNGQSQLVEALTGLRKIESGEVYFNNVRHTGKSSSSRPLIEKGMAHIPEDRQKFGLVLPFNIADNLILCTYYQMPFANHGMIQNNAILSNANNLIKRFDIRTSGPLMATSTLSGGNQQKVIVARELSRPIKLLIANQPTRGLDVGSIEYIHRQIVNMRDKGIGVLLVSAELDEIMALSDRIAVMYRGKIMDILPAKGATKEMLGLLMAGIHPNKKKSIKL
ncbi:MAG: ABC transporter ATP-binding protein [Anaerolineaceae bacterium]|nr:ABC transporter ATP-binding protein [Anaerolineaceae bacterium]